ncbi:MAG: hypothetical protein MPW15_16015 [Candidatus Manganitrophus sp.]|nr:hypothetical protein [Candidatus Manganitrophus sp.]MDC4225705.1 hypothetical protein [Candidatus Manganitrophus sp.]WDT74817.1 MAG: hypothetical protein MPW16_16325 [Candidatus Manganitrophus sp.]
MMKKTRGILFFVFVMGIFFIQADLGWGEKPSEKKNSPAASEEKPKSGDRQETAAECPPGLSGEFPSSRDQAAGLDGTANLGRRDQAVGNDSPLTKNSNEEIDAPHTPCPPASSDKGGAEAGKNGNGSKQPDNNSK